MSSILLQFANANAPEAATQIPPLLILVIGIAIVIGMIVAFNINAFIALITAAIVVSLMAPGEPALKLQRVADSFGGTAAGIGIVIALAAIIGQAMMQSGAADRVVKMFLGLLGEKRSGAALMGSGFTLAIPVFFDTAFYLLVPLARSLHRKTKTHYLKYLMAIAAGGAITHTLVPPTPGPLFIASQLGVDLGTMIIMGAVVALPAAIVGLMYGSWLDRKMPTPMRPIAEGAKEIEALPDDRLPNLVLSLAPILLPIVMITANSVVKVMAHHAIEADPSVLAHGETGKSFLAASGELKVLKDGEITEAILIAADQGVGVAGAFQWTNVIGNPNFALLISAAIAVLTLVQTRRPSKKELASQIEIALMSGGIIILITAAGGAFGGMLKAANLGDAIEAMFKGEGSSSLAGLGLLMLAFFMAALLKFAQGSSTASMIVTSGMMAAMLAGDDGGLRDIGVHYVYLALSIGCGSLIGSWMNDSGFWIYTKMGGLTEVESLKSWTILLIFLGVIGMAVTIVLSQVMPMNRLGA